MFGCDIGIEYGFRIVVMIELEKRVRVERKEEGYRGMREKKFFANRTKKFLHRQTYPEAHPNSL